MIFFRFFNLPIWHIFNMAKVTKYIYKKKTGKRRRVAIGIQLQTGLLDTAAVLARLKTDAWESCRSTGYKYFSSPRTLRVNS